MIDYLQSFNLTPELWFLCFICGMLVGMAKVGISGLAMLAVPILAEIFGGRPSTGILLPMLCIGDIFAVKYYTQHTEWFYVLRLMPFTLIGILIALFVGNNISDDLFKDIIAITILISITVMIWRERQQNNIVFPNRWWVSLLIGLTGGFATMIGNAAGPIMSLFLLSIQLPKNAYIGTGAWYFMIVNLVKVPLHIFIWNTITLRTFSLNIATLPAIALGSILGVKIVKKIPEKPYRIFIIVITSITALNLLI